jgi:hypothetical protein
MSELERWHAHDRADEAVLRFQTDQVVPASDLANLILILSKEYSRINRGRTLVVSEVYTGSLFVYIRDWMPASAEFAKESSEFLTAGAALGKFVGALRAAFGRSREDPQALTSRRPGFRVVKEVVRIAAERGAAVEIEYRAPRGEELSIRLAAPEVKALKEQSEQRLLVADAQRSALPEISMPPLAQRALTAGDHADAFEAAMGSQGAVVQGGVEALVGVLYSLGLASSLSDIAAELKARGRKDLAEAVAVAAQRYIVAGGASGPPGDVGFAR